MKEHPRPLDGLDEDAALRSILEGTATETGERFFSALVENLARALKTQGAWVTEYRKEERRLRALAFWMGEKWIRDYEYDVAGTPCERVVEGGQLVHHPENVISLYPDDRDLQEFSAASFMGLPLLDVDGGILGHLAVLDSRPMPEDPRAFALIRIFAARAAAELQRLRAEAEIREREEQLGGLVNSALDAIIKLDGQLRVTLMNPSGEKVLACSAAEVSGQSFADFLAEESHEKLTRLVKDLEDCGEERRYLWIPGGLQVRSAAGKGFPAEATLSRFEMRRDTYYTLILRDVNERLQAEQKIRSLTVEAEYLREELRALHNFDEIVGQSESVLRLLGDVEQVAVTDATVLIFGETGTGKELIARALHAASRRSDRPLIRVNCAAIAAALMESEFFGHEKGAFTGATEKREGRFALADGGTIFLDEVGELPIDLQAKLLRVLQEGEFEPVGSSRTSRVDVRVLAATNRDLREAVKAGRFREDLYYRLNVFPVTVPPLRERGDDVVLLASAFAKKFARRMGREIEPLSDECCRRLRSYGWPGNVRELENVIERALIISRGTRLDLDRALPEAAGGDVTAVPTADGDAVARIRTVEELQTLERENLRRALEAADWKVSGERGAARLLGMNPSTLNSRMKALGIRRPRP